jgi:hypothetical protein
MKLLITQKALLLNTVKSQTFILIMKLGNGYHILVNSLNQSLLWVQYLSMVKMLQLSELKTLQAKVSISESKIG